MHMKKLTVLLAVVAAGLLSLMGVGAADAAPKVPLGGGSGILVLKGGNSAAACTVTSVGRPTTGPNRGQLIAITAGHCGKPGQRVVSERFQSRGDIGRIAYSASDIDLAVIELNDNVAPLRTVRGVTIRKVNTTPVQFPTVLCKQGRTTGNTCGVTWFSDGTSHFSQMCVVEGDSGSPVVVGDQLVGMVNAYYFLSCLGPETGTNAKTIMNRLNRIGYNNFKPV
ncbi:trypsin-like serine protease [Gordonia sp. (in: high G+C Gram-positive bacteria)]|uniref:trypsin-like serine protease n=1 Tax=Gordonia sp. (in: high G+C Gram-positive bacteria) TaxID=84139 RepID=UPI0016A17259|nr:trypsin-like serine protease [Gordonia sp. (in: high G+C Gram-positive bacteria)]NLG46708.1 trypsin-like serine protease [Gordonia sp. (in: high G+C Gram-positive bacteria)]